MALTFHPRVREERRSWIGFFYDFQLEDNWRVWVFFFLIATCDHKRRERDENRSRRSGMITFLFDWELIVIFEIIIFWRFFLRFRKMAKKLNWNKKFYWFFLLPATRTRSGRAAEVTGSRETQSAAGQSGSAGSAQSRVVSASAGGGCRSGADESGRATTAGSTQDIQTGVGLDPS